MRPLELIEVGDEIGMIFPEELCARLQIGLGDEVHLTPTARGFSLHANRSDVGVLFEKIADCASMSQDSVA